MLNLYFVCLSLLLSVPDVVRCKPDYLYNAEVGGWLKLHRIPATWQEAFLRCHYEGAVLASPLNTQLATALHTLRIQSGVSDYIFLGTHALFSKGDFVSVEGVPLADLDVRWGPKDAKITNGHCLILSSNEEEYLMYTSSCDSPLPYICYRKRDNVTINKCCGTFDHGYQLKRQTGSCYKAHYKKQTWSTAYKICAAEGGHLVVLNDKVEASIVKAMFPERDVDDGDNFFTGLVAWGDDRTWITVNGEREEDVFHDWFPGQPDNSGGHQIYTSFLRAITLNDENPDAKAMFVCEKSPDKVRFETPTPTINRLTINRRLPADSGERVQLSSNNDCK